MCAHCLYLDSYTYPLMVRVRGSVIVSAAAVLGFVLLLVSSTGAVVFDGPTDTINDEVALQPGDNPYTYLDENGELVIDVSDDNSRLDAEGVNADALTIEDELFYVVYNGSEPAEVWIEHDSKAVTFVIKGQPAETAEDPALVTAEDETVPVGVRVDTRVADLLPGDRVLDEITVRARPADPEAIEPQTEANGDDEDGDGSENGDDENGDDEDDEDGDDGDGDENENGTGDDDDDSGDNDSSTVVTLDSPDPATREVEVLSLAADTEIEVDLEGARVGGPGIELERVAFTPEESGDVAFDVEGYETAPESVDPVDRPGVDPLGYYEVSFAESAPPVAEATAELVVDRDRLDAAGVDPDRLAAYHETEDGWETTSLAVLAADDETVRLAITSDGFSAFALAAQRPALDPVDADPAAETVAPGEPLPVEVTVENAGPVPASDADLRLRSAETGDEPPAVDRGAFAVDVAPETTAERTVTVRLDEPGEYDLVVDGERVADPEPVASVTVTDAANGSETDGEAAAGSETADGGSETTDDATPDEREEASDDAPTTERSNFELADLAGLAALIAIVLGTLFLVRRAPR